MVRRTRAELVETIERSRAIYGPLKLTEQTLAGAGRSSAAVRLPRARR